MLHYDGLGTVVTVSNAGDGYACTKWQILHCDKSNV